jgi:succinoglycan biosynthesis transport protein ExoP
MDTFDSHRSTLPARLPGGRPGSQALRTTAASTAGVPATTMSLRVVWRGARRYWWLVLILWMTCSSLIGTVVYLYVKPSYRALSLLRVDPAANDIFQARNAEPLDTFLKTQVELITSPNVLTAAGTNPKVALLERVQNAGDVVQELRKAVTVAVVPNTYLIEVSVTSPNPAEAATIVNAVVESFLEANSEWSDGMTRLQIKNLEQYNLDLKNQTDEIERKWKALASKGDVDIAPGGDRKKDDSGGSKPEASTNRASITIEEYKEVRRDLNLVKRELAEAQALLTAAEDAANKIGTTPNGGVADQQSTIIDAQVSRKLKVDHDVATLAGQVMQARHKLADHRRVVVQAGDPAERAAKRKLDSLEAQYKQMCESKMQTFREEIEGGNGDGKGFDPHREVVEARAVVQKLQARQSALTVQFDKLDVKNKTQAADTVDISVLQDERSTVRGLQDDVVRRLEQLKYEAKGEARIRPVNANGAMVPGKPISDKRYTFLAATPVGVLGVVLGLIVLLEIRSGRVDDPELLSTRMNHEVFSIAPLPDLRPGDDANSEKAEQRLARFVQSLDHLRVAICESGIHGEGRCVMITSATGGEGKTTLSAHLAARCANAGTSTLLVDADMRRASLGRLLDVPVGPGLGDVLAGEIDLDDATITVQAGGFHFLSAGTPGRDPSRVLKSHRFSELIARLRQTYDLVIIDTPPVLPVADALIMGRWVDGAVMAARFDASRLPLVERANRQLALAGIPVLGVVVNGVRAREATYGNYAYSYNAYSPRPGSSAEAPTS